jgi:sialate O-acetylesterase
MHFVLKTKLILVTVALALLAAATQASLAGNLRFAAPFVDHMVIQRDKPIDLWGTATAGNTVVIRLDAQQAEGKADGDGNWHVTLKAVPAGGPFTLSGTSGTETTTITDVLAGDVWLCSGQSNMQYSLGESADGAAIAAMPHPNLRLGRVGTAWTKTPQTSAKISWSDANPDGARSFSAVAYYFAHELQKDPSNAKVPIGMLEDCLGATVIESWIPKHGLSGIPSQDLQSSMFGIGPTLLYNGMIAPLGNTALTGVIWYQGEGNSGQPERYQKLLPILIKTWREQFRDPHLPFLIVQLPDYAPDFGGVYWQWIREAQAKAAASTPETFLAVTINTNNGWNLHPQGKHEIGRRLALLARQDVYKEKIVGAGPTYESARADGTRLIVTFKTDNDGLSSGTRPVDGFMIAGADGVYHLASAIIDGDSVVLTSADVPAPVTVRYAWAGVPDSTLTDRAGLPAAPFRTDNQPVSKGHGEPQWQMPGFTFTGKAYHIDISGEGRITSLIVHNQQFLSNAPGTWGGTSLGNRNLSELKLVAPTSLLCSNNETKLRIEFSDNSMRWTLVNTHPKDDVKFHIALNSAVQVGVQGPNGVMIHRKDSSARVTGVDRIINWKDVAADDAKVLETDIPHGESKTIELFFGPE